MIRERREHKRISVMMKIDYATQQKDKTGYSTNLSLGGIFLQTEKPGNIGQPIKLRFWLPGSKAPMQLDGQVVRQNFSRTKENSEPSGIGIRFCNVPREVKKPLGDFLDQFNSSYIGFFNRNNLWSDKGV